MSFVFICCCARWDPLILLGFFGHDIYHENDKLATHTGMS